MRIRDPGWRQFGIRDGKKSDPGSGINIPDPLHWILNIRICALYDSVAYICCLNDYSVWSRLVWFSWFSGSWSRKGPQKRKTEFETSSKEKISTFLFRTLHIFFLSCTNFEIQLLIKPLGLESDPDSLIVDLQHQCQKKGKIINENYQHRKLGKES
jgi:hypothetical protein